MLLVVNGEKYDGTFYDKELQKTNQKEFSVEKVIKRKGDKIYVKWKGCNNSLTVGLIKKQYKMSEYFHKQRALS